MSTARRIREWTQRINEIAAPVGVRVLGTHHNKHLKFLLSNGQTFVMATTASDWRTDLNTVQGLKRMLGIEQKKPVEPKKRARAVTTRPKAETPPARSWRPGSGQPERIQNPHARKRLGLDAPPPQPIVKLGRPILTLKGKSSCTPTGAQPSASSPRPSGSASLSGA